nr:unnamed protein product [Callosobruchus chinensis]
MFRCEVCFRSFHLKSNLKQHAIALNHMDGFIPFGCRTCGRSYKRKSELTRHLRYECQKEKMFACKICFKSFHIKSSLKRHAVTLNHLEGFEDSSNAIISGYNSEVYSCGKCRKQYSCRGNLTRHINLECGGQRKFNCPACSYKAFRKDHIKRHMLLVHSYQPNLFIDLMYECNHNRLQQLGPQIQFTIENRLNTFGYLQADSDSGSLPPTYLFSFYKTKQKCSPQFKTSDKIVKSEFKTISIECIYHKLYFRIKLSINKQLSNLRFGVLLGYQFVCPQCGKNYRRADSLKRHLRNECNNYGRFECRLCFKLFKHKFVMPSHTYKCKGRRNIKSSLPVKYLNIIKIDFEGLGNLIYLDNFAYF